MGTSTASDRCARQRIDVPDESRVLPSAPVQGESTVEMGPEKENFSFSPPASDEDLETIHSADSGDVSSYETDSGFPVEPNISSTEATTVAETCLADVFVPVMGSEVLELENSGEEVRKMKETDTLIASSGFSVESDNFDGDNTRSVDGVNVPSSEIQAFDGHNLEEESLNLEEKRKEKEAQRISEAEIEVGTTFGEKANAGTVTSDSSFLKNGNCYQNQQETVERMILKDHAFAGRSLMVEVIDDTAVVDVFPIYKKGNAHPKRLETVRTENQNIGEVTVDRRQGKGARRKGKGKGNAAKVDNISVQVSEFGVLGEKNGNPSKIAYSRKQMEAMRFAKISDQRKLWSDIFAGLASEVVTEYEGLASLKNSKPNRDRGQPIPRNLDIGILGPVAAVPRRNHSNIFVH
ncbi:PREDICTED: uncharacterized protein LOC104798849 isoform X2 [Tarenaya hassleriana]|uniref:uncharacterized protein LOC104798849 isoform X2 n=1 Tax=Tarenaya hassleriana TaxID=28532 RepID=UPI00053C7ECF|nr:PREDICTED: uncharacterized protein LOC104798849 isoform X2 [Tarenaya hassleriana]